MRKSLQFQDEKPTETHKLSNESMPCNYQYGWLIGRQGWE